MHKILLSLFLLLATSSPCNGLQLGGLSYLEQVNPGEQKRVKITLINDKDEEEDVDFKLCDYATHCDGEHRMEEIGTLDRTNGPWITLSSTRVRLSPKETSDFYLTIDVPKDDDLKGSYWSILLVEPNKPVQSISTEDNGFTLNVKIRYAYHIITNVNQGTAKLKILNKEFKTIDDKQVFTVDVSNTGEIFLNPKLILKLYDAKGKLAKTVDGQAERLYPGSSQRYYLNLQEPNDQKYTAFLVLDNGDDHLFGDSFELPLTKNSSPPLQISKDSPLNAPLSIETPALFLEQDYLYRGAAEILNLDDLKAAGFSHRKWVNISKMNPFAMRQPRELSEWSKSKFQLLLGIIFP